MLFNQEIDPNTGQTRQNALVRWVMGVWHWFVPPTLAHADRQTKAAKRARALILFAIPMLIAGIGLYNARDFYQGYQNWSAKRIMKDAKSFLDEERHYDAYLKVLEAHSLNPDNEDAIRMLGHLYAASNRNEAVYFLDKLQEKGVATVEDMQTKVKAFMNLGQTKQASELLQRVMNEYPPNDAMLKLAEEVWGTQDKNEIVIKALKEYVEHHPEDVESQLRLARFQMKSGTVGEMGAAMETMWKAAEDNGEQGLKAIEEIDALPSISPTDALRLVQRLNEHPKANNWHKVAALKREVQLYPARKNRIIIEAVEMFRDEKRENLLPFILWLKEMAQQGPTGDPAMFAHILTLVSEEEAKQYEPLLLNYLTALTALKRMDELQRLVGDPAIAKILKKSVLAFYRAHMAFVTGKSGDEVRRHLTVALTSAQDDGFADGLLDIGRYAEERGFLDVAEEAYRARSVISRRERAGFEGLVRVCQASGNMEGLIEATHEAVRRWPDDDNFMERYLYANIIAGKNVELSLERALRTLERHKDDSGWKLLVALAYHRLGDIEMALQHMQKINLNNVSTGQQAAFAAMALEGGFPSEAKLVVNAIPSTAAMLPKEAEFFERVLAQTKGIANTKMN